MSSRRTSDAAPASASAPAWPAFALHTIRALPLDPDFPLYLQYPAMKLGVRDSVRHYARLLLPLAREIVRRQPESRNWVVTAPPFFAIPAAANLLAREVLRLLEEELPDSYSFRLLEMRFALPTGPPHEAMADNYSSYGLAARVANGRRLYDADRAPRLDPGDFRGRAVLYVNDINVTGTQQAFMRQAFAAVGPASVDWLYIFLVDPALSRAHPELEYSLNHLRLETFEAFEEVVRLAEIDFTARCVGRLFACPAAQLEQLFPRLTEERRLALFELAAEEARYTQAADQTSLTLLRERLGPRSPPKERS